MQSIIQEYSKVTGTNQIVLKGHLPGCKRVGFAYDDGDTAHYYIYHNDLRDEWEQGIGTFRQASNVLERTTVTGSSNAGEKTEFSAGEKTVVVAMRTVVPTFATDPAGVGKGELVLVDGALKVGDGEALVETGGSMTGGSMTGAEIKTAYEAEADTNAYTDSEKTKLAGVADGAEVNAVDSVNGQTGAVTLGPVDVLDGDTVTGANPNGTSWVVGSSSVVLMPGGILENEYTFLAPSGETSGLTTILVNKCGAAATIKGVTGGDITLANDRTIALLYYNGAWYRPDYTA